MMMPAVTATAVTATAGVAAAEALSTTTETLAATEALL
jgi:hypothetical protein